ncbi:FixH family protein [uncultured Photobacterium sp.]|uniref:FixH family protein n=1 Tax=uncultured Photobacterium sp. TaxID=173973 RepID=UPI002617B7EC|nr:FixH family protein [uncultured Photobacterium sp.]
MIYKCAVLLLLILTSSPSEASSEFPLTVHHPLYTITAEPAEKTVTLNKIHQWLITINDINGHPIQGLQFDVKGGMPNHQHGLPTQPRLIGENEPGKYLIDGMKFNMHGKWQLELINIDSDFPFKYQIEFELNHANSK